MSGMEDVETRALARAAGLLLVLSAVRLGWSRARTPVKTEGTGEDVLPGLLKKSRAGVADAARRGRPLSPGEKIDPNRASAAELDRLPGVGPSLARAIVADRQRNGPFRSPADLERVPGLGSGIRQRIGARLDLRHPPPAGPRPVLAPSSATRSTRPVAPTSARPTGAPPVDVNRADTTALTSLPGVGPVLARRIVESRRRSPFRNLQDLARVKGIGPAALARLRGRVRFAPGP